MLLNPLTLLIRIAFTLGIRQPGRSTIHADYKESQDYAYKKHPNLDVDWLILFVVPDFFMTMSAHYSHPRLDFPGWIVSQQLILEQFYSALSMVFIGV